jgi:hypothetical protein
MHIEGLCHHSSINLSFKSHLFTSSSRESSMLSSSMQQWMKWTLFPSSLDLTQPPQCILGGDALVYTSSILCHCHYSNSDHFYFIPKLWNFMIVHHSSSPSLLIHHSQDHFFNTLFLLHWHFILKQCFYVVYNF